MINIEELLQPISPEEPCGVDVSYEPAMQELETLLVGKPETQFSPAEEPRWEEVRDRCVELLRRSKNLRVSVVLCLALLRVGGLPGFGDAFVLLQRMLVQYWESLFPRLDPDDNNDPTERVNILAALVTPFGSFEDPMQFLRRLREAPLTDSTRVGRFSLADIVPAKTPGAEAVAPVANATQVQAAFRDTPPEKLERLANAVSDSIKAAKAIDEFLTRTIGANRAPDWTPLLSTLLEIAKTLPADMSHLLPANGTSDGDAAQSGAPARAASGAGNGAIESRQDVVRTLERVCEYYSRAEPASPVPLLLRRAQRLVEMNFLEIIADLSPDAVTQIRNVAGTEPPPST